eukprot:scaffold72935_cov63-Phaeocystis_antarctica.AAC.2
MGLDSSSSLYGSSGSLRNSLVSSSTCTGAVAGEHVAVGRGRSRVGRGARGSGGGARGRGAYEVEQRVITLEHPDDLRGHGTA